MANSRAKSLASYSSAARRLTDNKERITRALGASAFILGPVSPLPISCNGCEATARLSIQQDRITRADRAPINEERLTINPPRSGVPLTINHVKTGVAGFTLVELVVVILIISTLAALLFTGGSTMFDRARKTQAKNDLVQLVNAINAFYTEYGQYPVAAQTGADSADYPTSQTDANNAAVLDVLRVPAAAPTQPLNPRSIVFLNVPVAKSTTTPLAGIGTTTRAWYDPWGKAYQFRIDNNYNNTLVNPYSANAGPSSLNFGCIAWSLGKNKIGGSGDKNATAAVDDVISWY